MAKILLVEDDNNLREIFEMRLQAEGYDTLAASDGEEALVVALKEKPDLIIADVMMPKMSGFEMLETLRASPDMSKVKVVMMTALGQAEDQARGEKLGVVKYLVKSQVTLEDFVRVVKEVLGSAGKASADKASEGEEVPKQPSLINKESEQTMPPADNNQPAGDGTTPTGGANPISGGAPASDGAMSTDQAKQGMADQVNDFASSAPAGDDATAAAPSMPAPGTDMPGAPMPAPGADMPGAPTPPPADGAPAEGSSTLPGGV
jgi:CheY-like chemotaxis protein